MGDMLYRASQDTGAKQNTCMLNLSSLTLHLEHLPGASAGNTWQVEHL